MEFCSRRDMWRFPGRRTLGGVSCFAVGWTLVSVSVATRAQAHVFAGCLPRDSCSAGAGRASRLERARTRARRRPSCFIDQSRIVPRAATASGHANLPVGGHVLPC